MRINGFEQIKAFYSEVFNGEYPFRTSHISLYVFLINQNNRNMWIEWFKCPYDLAMAGACIGSKNTYYKCLKDLEEWGFIKYEKGANNWKAPKISLQKLSIKNIPLSEKVSEPLPEHLTVPLGDNLTGKRYKLITSNIQRVTDSLTKILNESDLSTLGIQEPIDAFEEFTGSITPSKKIAKDVLRTHGGELIRLMNDLIGTDFSVNEENLKNIGIVLSLGKFNPQDLELVMRYKLKDWDNDKFRGNRNPKTIFNPKNFENYANAARQEFNKPKKIGKHNVDDLERAINEMVESRGD